LSKEKEKPATLKDLEEMGQAWEEKFQSLREETGERSSLSNTEKSDKNGGESVAKYRCKNGNCGFYADDANEMILHVLEEHMSKPAPAKEGEETPPAPKMRHGMTADELVNCPECRGRLEKAFEKVGYSVKKVEPEPKKEEKPKKRGLF